MNRKILIGILIVFGVGFFLYLQSHKNRKSKQEDFASSTEATKPVRNNKVTQNEVEKESPIRNPNAIDTPKSGKYSLHISKPMAPIQDEIKKREQYLKNNNAGLTLQSSDQSFVLMKLRASKNKENIEDKALGHELFPVDLEYARKVIVDDNSYPVVYRESNGRLGLLTGVILIQTQDKIEADKLTLKYPIDLQMYDSSIELASYKVRDGEGLYDVFNSIKQTERIKSVTVEVLDSYKGF